MSKRSRRRDGRRRSAQRRSVPQAEAAVQDTVDFREEYHYVLADLKRIGMLAAMMIAVLVALSLVLP